MAKDHGPSIKDPEMFEALTAQGMPEGKAAAISNAAARDGRRAVGKRGGRADDLESRTVPELRARAKELGIAGVSRLRKAELVERIRKG